jgi:hypothetical protein
MLLLLSLSLLDLASALGTKYMAPAKPPSAPGTRQLETGFEMFNGNHATVEVYVLNRQS